MTMIPTPHPHTSRPWNIRLMSEVKTRLGLLRPSMPPYFPPWHQASLAEVHASKASVSEATDQTVTFKAASAAQTIASRPGRWVEDMELQEHAEAGQISPTSEDVNAIEPAPRAATSLLPVTCQSSIHELSALKRDCPFRTDSVTDMQRVFAAHTRQSHPLAEIESAYTSSDRSSVELVPESVIPRHVEESTSRLSSLRNPLQQPQLSRSSSLTSLRMGQRPRATFRRLSSLDGLRTYQEEKAAWKKASSIVHLAISKSEESCYGRARATASRLERLQGPDETDERRIWTPASSEYGEVEMVWSDSSVLSVPYEFQQCPEMCEEQIKNTFRHFAAEVGFCFTIAMTQFLAEYMISGFAIELPRILKRHTEVDGMGQFWPASLLSLILSATLLIFARISDMYGGYLPFMFGVIWLGSWSLVAGFAGVGVLLDVARSMQGLAIAAFIPSTFAMIGSIYPEGPRKNFVLGLYAGCAPLGFFSGFLVAGALPESTPGWYFWIAAALSFLSAVTAYLTVPHDRIDRDRLHLKMDWMGAVLITAGLVLVSYALAVEPFANQSDTSRSGWTFPIVLVPLSVGLGCLVVAFWVEGWLASCPLLPFDFYKPQSIKAFSLACLCFYATYGVWLYESAQFFQSPAVTGTENGIQGVALAAWYTPTAVGGLVLCVAGGALLHRVPIMSLLFVSALAWIASPLLLALCPLPLQYWSFVMPSMLCATLGIDLTFTVSIVFLSSVQPLKYQGLAGAVSSILVNLAMSFSLSTSEIVSATARNTITMPAIQDSTYAAAVARAEVWGYRCSFVYAAASAGLGLGICVLFPRAPLESSTLVEGYGRHCGIYLDTEVGLRPKSGLV